MQSYYAGNVQGVENGKEIVPQEICVLDLANDRTYHAFVKIDKGVVSDKACEYPWRRIHGIPPAYGPPADYTKLKTFVGEGEGILYVKGCQQAQTFRKLLTGANVTVQSVGPIKTCLQKEKRCKFHKEKKDSFYCALERTHGLKTALTKKPVEEPRSCFFHSECHQPEDLCRILWGSGTYETLTSFWSPCCVLCQSPLESLGAYYFCTSTECKKFNQCVLKVDNRNESTGVVRYVSGVRLTDYEMKKKYYSNW